MRLGSEEGRGGAGSRGEPCENEVEGVVTGAHRGGRAREVGKNRSVIRVIGPGAPESLSHPIVPPHALPSGP